MVRTRAKVFLISLHSCKDAAYDGDLNHYHDLLFDGDYVFLFLPLVCVCVCVCVCGKSLTSIGISSCCSSDFEYDPCTQSIPSHYNYNQKK